MHLFFSNQHQNCPSKAKTGLKKHCLLAEKDKDARPPGQCMWNVLKNNFEMNSLDETLLQSRFYRGAVGFVRARWECSRKRTCSFWRSLYLGVNPCRKPVTESQGRSFLYQQMTLSMEHAGWDLNFSFVRGLASKLGSCTLQFSLQPRSGVSFVCSLACTTFPGANLLGFLVQFAQ